MTKLLLTLLLVIAVIAGGVLFFSGDEPAPITTAAVNRGDVVNELSTNGRIEAARRHDVISAVSGPITRVDIALGLDIGQGQTIAVVENHSARSDAEQARARLESAEAELAAIQRGMTPTDRIQTENRLSTAERSLAGLRTDLERTKRLVDRAAAPRVELETLQRRVAETESEVGMLRSTLTVGPDDARLEQARAAIREAQVALEETERRAGSALIRSPAEGRVYSLNVRPGDFVSPGDLIARIAQVGPLEARIYIDEPELGRIDLGYRARLTADAYPGRQWSCIIERLPTEIIELDNRRIGEVVCTVTAQDDRLIPNLTVNVAIETAKSENTLLIPREALLADAGGYAVLTPSGDRTPVEVGVRGTEFVEVLSGVEENELVQIPREGAR